MTLPELHPPVKGIFNAMYPPDWFEQLLLDCVHPESVPHSKSQFVGDENAGEVQASKNPAATHAATILTPNE